jgi:hypothetical protein
VARLVEAIGDLVAVQHGAVDPDDDDTVGDAVERAREAITLVGDRAHTVRDAGRRNRDRVLRIMGPSPRDEQRHETHERQHDPDDERYHVHRFQVLRIWWASASISRTAR